MPIEMAPKSLEHGHSSLLFKFIFIFMMPVRTVYAGSRSIIMNCTICRDVPIWNFADNPITDCCIKLSADTDTDTDIEAYVQSLHS